MEPSVETIDRRDCLFCGTPCTNGDKIVEVKHRLKSKLLTHKGANWTRAHLGCAKEGLGENERIPPRKIRSIRTKRRIQPNKIVESWISIKPERGVIRGTN